MIDFRQFEAMTFDCYGTLIDWESGILSVLGPLRDRFDVPASDRSLLEAFAHAEAHIERGYYRPYREVLREVLIQVAGRYSMPLDEINVEALAQSIRHWKPFPDTVASLATLGAYFRLGIVSNVDNDLFEGTLETLCTRFHSVTTAETAGSYKPAHRVFRLARERLDVHPSRVVHVAQSRFHDIRPADDLGWSTVWVDRRGGLTGGGATPASDARPGLTVFDLASLCRAVSRSAGPPRGAVDSAVRIG